jgi:hypothetical protein
MAVRLSALSAGALYPQEDSWYSFLLEAESTQGHSAVGRIRSIGKTSDLIGNRTRLLSVCSIIPQSNTLPYAQIYFENSLLYTSQFPGTLNSVIQRLSSVNLLMFPDEVRLETLFIRCKGGVEICKKTIDTYYTLRSAIPEIFCHRDPYKPWFKQASSLR